MKRTQAATPKKSASDSMAEAKTKANMKAKAEEAKTEAKPAAQPKTSTKGTSAVVKSAYGPEKQQQVAGKKRTREEAGLPEGRKEEEAAK